MKANLDLDEAQMKVAAEEERKRRRESDSKCPGGRGQEVLDLPETVLNPFREALTRQTTSWLTSTRLARSLLTLPASSSETWHRAY